MRALPPTASEQLFFNILSRRIADLQDWYHADEDGSLWMIVSYDFVRNGVVTATLRCDYDGKRLLGGWSPACLNWDDGVRATVAVETSAPDGIEADVLGAEEAAITAAEWFASHIRKWFVT